MAARHISSDLLCGDGVEDDRRISCNRQSAQSDDNAISQPYSNLHVDACAHLDDPANGHALAYSNIDQVKLLFRILLDFCPSDGNMRSQPGVVLEKGQVGLQ